MSDEDALLAAIIANPDEDTPRLVYADWLDENGQPERAEFIRLQCRMAGATEFSWEDDRRLGELEMIAHKQKWLSVMPEYEHGQWEFCRGMPERLTIRCDSFFAHAEQLLGEAWLRELCLYDVMNWDVEKLTLLLWNRRWDGLFLGEHPMSGIFVHGYDAEPSVRMIATCPHAQQLKRLELSMFGYTDASILALATSPYLEQLQKLSLGCDVNAPAFEPLRVRFGSRLTADSLF